MFEGELQEAGVQAADLDRRTKLGFATWFRNHVSCIIFLFQYALCFG
jgi:hypothetical protein